MCSTPTIPMGSERTKKCFGVLLTTILLFQLSYHTLHVITSHTLDSHVHQTVHDTQIDKTSFTCELCAKLLGQTLFLWGFPILLLNIGALRFVIDIREFLFEPRPLTAYFLRGPPSPSPLF